METTIKKSNSFQVAEIQLSYKSKVKASLRPKITSSVSAYEILKASWDSSTIELFEQFKVLLISRANKVLAIFEASSGGISGTVADLKLIFVAALKAKSNGLILCHNHPSGNLTPSQDDINLTKRVKEAGKLLDITLLDHIIISSEGYYSFGDNAVL